MPEDVFGDLREWGDVLLKLEELRTTEALDRHQPGLARLMRCKDNWRLREEALISAARIRRPSATLVQTTLRLLSDEDDLLENRILAAHALGLMLSLSRVEAESEVCVEEVLAAMKSLLRDGGPPVFQEAMRRACETAASIS